MSPLIYCFLARYLRYAKKQSSGKRGTRLRDINYMPVVIFFAYLDLEPDSVDFETLVNQQTHLSFSSSIS